MVLPLLEKKIRADQKGKYIGVDTITNIQQLGDDDLDLEALKSLIDHKKDSNDYAK